MTLFRVLFLFLAALVAALAGTTPVRFYRDRICVPVPSISEEKRIH